MAKLIRPLAHGALFLLALLSAAAAPAAEPVRLPTGLFLTPAGSSIDLGRMPLALALAPGGERAVALLSGWHDQGLQVIDWRAGRVVQTIAQPGAFLGLAFSPDGRTLYTSGGDADVVYRYKWQDGQAAAGGQLVLAAKEPDKNGTRYPAGIALSPDGRRLYVAENVGNSLAVLELPEGRIVQRLTTGDYPYAVAVKADGTVFVSCWGTDSVQVFAPGADGMLAESGRIEAGRHPSALLLNADGSRLFVASASTDRVGVVDTKSRKMVKVLADSPPSGPGEGSTPNALALSSDGSRLLVAEADSNAVAVFALSAKTAGRRGVRGRDRLVGRVPTGWYPAALLALSDTVLVAEAKGRGTAPNPGMVQPPAKLEPTSRDYVFGQLHGTLTAIPAAAFRDLAAGTRQVAKNNGWDRRRPAPSHPPFKHVIYVIKENRTYDQVLGDIPGADGDPSLVFFPRAVSPNHHALAERFGLYDRFFVNAEVSAQGHPWSDSAYVTDFSEKTVQSGYAGQRGEDPEGEADDPVNGYLWESARRAGKRVRIYGEGAEHDPAAPGRFRSFLPGAKEITDPRYAGFDMAIPDQQRIEIWLGDFQEAVRQGEMPALQVVYLPSDHTSGARPGMRTPRACMADNDLALGRLVDALSHSPFWRDTVVFVLEDDAQSGPDHVDSHRSVLQVISAYGRPGVRHRFVNTTDVFASIEGILGLGSLSQFDHFGRPLWDVFAAEPDLTPYTALTPEVPLDEKNPGGSAAAEASLKLPLDERPDAADDEEFNRVLWAAIKGEGVPMPEPVRMPTLGWVGLDE